MQYADVFGIAGAHELMHRITDWRDTNRTAEEPNDIMSINGNVMDPQKVALTDKEKAALLQKCQDLHK